jgi:undecaprenyl-diphosphatase
MNLIQAVVFSALQSLSDILPLDSRIAEHLLNGQVQWESAPPSLLALIKLGTFSAITLYFRHDVLSLISSFLSVIIFRRKPMTMDERLPFFILLSVLFPILSHSVVLTHLQKQEIQFWVYPLISMGLVFALSFADQLSRRTKASYDWTVKEAVILGVVACSSNLPGMGFMTAALITALLSNFNREAASKYAFLVLAPYLVFQTILSWSQSDATGATLIQGGEQILIASVTLDLLAALLSLTAAFVLTWICISSWMKSVDRGAIRSALVLRTLLVISIPVTHWLMNR